MFYTSTVKTSLHLLKVAYSYSLACCPQLSIRFLSAKRISWLPNDLINQFDLYKRKVLSEYEEITTQLSTNFLGDQKKLSERWNKLRPIVEVIEELELLSKTDAEVEELILDLVNSDKNSSDDSNDLSDLIQLERNQRDKQQQVLEQKLLDLLAPINPVTLESGVTLELFAGAGGREAGLFACDMLEMYRAFSVNRNWVFNVVHESQMSGTEDTETGSETPLAYARVQIEGPPSFNTDENASILSPVGAYGLLRWEAGVHRVQRVPVTSKLNKIHTSTVAVAVLPISDNVDLNISDSDLKWEYYRASGAGGQHVNRTDSAVRLTHLPTGTVVTCQRERLQHVNKQVALKILSERLQNERIQSQFEQFDFVRRSHIGNMDRSEKIRTYNFQQDRITDHRLGRSWVGLLRFMKQTIGLSEALEALHQRERINQIRQILNQFC